MAQTKTNNAAKKPAAKPKTATKPKAAEGIGAMVPILLPAPLASQLRDDAARHELPVEVFIQAVLHDWKSQREM